MFLARTIEDIIQHAEAETEIIAVLDGQWAEPGIPQHPMVNVIYVPESIGQRAATNIAARLAKGKYVAKVDAHCTFEQGFDRKMLDAFKELGDDVTMAPVMKNLYAFDWICPDGHTRYQGPSGPCKDCGKETTRDMKWFAKTRPNSASFCFDAEPHFQYFNEYTRTEKFLKDREATGYTETMSLQGSFFMCSRAKYFELNLSDENFGSWGNQGIEVACKTWLSGGRVMINHKTHYAHMFRTQGGDFGFPYHQSGSEVQKTKAKVKDLFFNNKWDKQVHPLSWLVERFWPIKGWTQEQLDKLK